MIYTEGDNIALCVLNIIMEFHAHNLEDILLYFPEEKKKYVERAIGNLLFIKDLRKVSVNGVDRIYPYGVYKDYEEQEERRLAKPLTVFRYLLQAKDENGEYIYLNDIEYYTVAAFPYAIVFKYKDKTIYILNADSNDYSNFNVLMNELDKRDGLQSNESRIIVTDSSENLEKLEVRNVINVVAVDSENKITFLK